MTQPRILFWAFCVLLSSAPSWAISKDIPHGVKFSWVDAQHHPTELNWPTRLLWRWQGDGGEENLHHRPVLRLWIAVPARFEIKKMTPDPGDPLQVFNSPQDYPELTSPDFASNGTHIVAIDILDVFSTATVTFELKDLNKKTDLQLLLHLQVEPSEPNQVLDPICERLGISFTKRKGLAKFFFIAHRCEDNYDAITLDILTSSDAQFGEHTAMAKSIEINEHTRRYILRKPEYMDGPSSVGANIVSNPQNADASEYVSYWYPHVVPRPLRLSVGLGTTYISYSESFTGIAVQEVLLTGKASISYTLIPRLLALDLSGYSSIIPVYAATQPQLLGTSRFYGINTRFGYELPVNFDMTHWRFLVGWYFVGMNAQRNNYGIGAMAGPQLFIATRTQQVGHREWSAYVKYALIGQGQFSASSYELALGGGFQISNPLNSRPWILTIDASQISVPIPVLPSILSLYTLSLGISTSF